MTKTYKNFYAYRHHIVMVLVCHGLLTTFLHAKPVPDPRRTPVVTAVEKVLPSVVNVSAERGGSAIGAAAGFNPYGNAFDRFFGSDPRAAWSPTDSVLGSGVVLDESGLILTTAHVVRDATAITVTTADGSSFKAATIAVSERDDLALLRLTDMPTPNRLRPITMEKPDDLLLGETVIAVGNPFGLGHSVGVGVLSARNRRVTANDQSLFEDVLQTDAPINPGNSGGPLVNVRGKLIGINQAVENNAQRIGFAIPVSRLEEIVVSWLIPSRFSPASLGFISETVVGRNGQTRVRIKQVLPGSPAESAGLTAGELITAVDGKALDRALSLARMIWSKKAGDKVTLTLRNDRTLALTLEELPDMTAVALAGKWLGLELKELSPRIADALGLQQLEGMVVSAVKPEFDRRDGLQRGDVITRIGDMSVASMADVKKALAGVRHGDVVPVAVHRAATGAGSTRFSGFVLDIAL